MSPHTVLTWLHSPKKSYTLFSTLAVSFVTLNRVFSFSLVEFPLPVHEASIYICLVFSTYGILDGSLLTQLKQPGLQLPINPRDIHILCLLLLGYKEGFSSQGHSQKMPLPWETPGIFLLASILLNAFPTIFKEVSINQTISQPQTPSSFFFQALNQHVLAFFP